jgi:hypothetical protein
MLGVNGVNSGGRSQVINIRVDASQHLKIIHESSARKLKNVFFQNFLL